MGIDNLKHNPFVRYASNDNFTIEGISIKCKLICRARPWPPSAKCERGP